MVSGSRIVAAGALLLAACGGTNDEPGEGSNGVSEVGGTGTAVSAPVRVGSIAIDNLGGSMEGHTPRGFAGSGTGLFAGDNLNPGFPDGDGVQIFLTFELPTGIAAIDGATLRSDALSVFGGPFDTLGPLRAAPVTYDEFGPPLYDLVADGPAVDCSRDGETGLTCDVGAAVSELVDGKTDRVQFRLSFERVADGDGSQDLAMFFLTDSNTNEPGIFVLEIDAVDG